jgi:hypothetical protein
VHQLLAALAALHGGDLGIEAVPPMTDVPNPIVDHARSVCLCDQGGHGLAAVTAVDSNGNTTLFVADTSLLGCDGVDHGVIPCHERLRPLPGHIRRRLLVCGRRTAKDRPCRLAVDELGGSCCFHRDRSGHRS